MDGRRIKDIIGAAKSRKPTFVFKNARVVNVFSGEIAQCDVAVFHSTIIGLGRYSCENEYDCGGAYLCPGFIDSHAHVEASMLTPAEYARLVLPCGTTFAIADPHDIAAVLGIAGVRYMSREAEHLGMEIYNMLPSGAPASAFDPSGKRLSAKESAQLIWEGMVYGMGEIMDSAALLSGDEDMLSRLNLFDGRVIDGFTPGLSGSALFAYIAAGANTCRDFSGIAELTEKLRAGMKVQLRAGSAANNILPLMKKLAQSGLPLSNVMFCSDDKAAFAIEEHGHINHNARLAVRAGIAPVDAVKMATLNAALAYRLPGKGAIAPGYDADIAIFDDIENFNVRDVFVAGKNIGDLQTPPQDVASTVSGNSVNFRPVNSAQFFIKTDGSAYVLEMPHGQLRKKLLLEAVPTRKGFFAPDAVYQKIAVIERHSSTGDLGMGIVKNFGLASGALAASVAHDSHNIVVIGHEGADMALAAEHLRTMRGGYALAENGRIIAEIPLPIAGLMSDLPHSQLISQQKNMLRELKKRGVSLKSDPLTRLSYYTHTALPAAALTTKGLYTNSI